MAVSVTVEQTIFKEILARRIPMVLDRVQKAPLTPSKEIFEQIRLTLSFACHEFAAEVWVETRNFLLTIAPKMEQAGYRDGWMSLLQQAITFSEHIGDPVARAELQLHLGVLCQLRTNYEEARRHLEASIEGFERLALPHQQARALNRLAYVARFQRRFEEAIRLVETARSLLAHDSEVAFGYFVLGLVTLDKREWPAAVRYARMAFNRWEAVENRRMMGRSLMCLGVASEKMQQFQAAIDAAQKAIALFEAIDDRIYLAAAQMNLGNVYVMLEQPEQALNLYIPAEKHFHRFQDRYSLALITHNMAMAYQRLQQWADAEAAFLQSIEYRKKLGNIVNLVNSMDGLGEIYLVQGNLTAAKSVLESALDELVKIKGEPGYEKRWEMVTGHLAAVNRRLRD